MAIATVTESPVITVRASKVRVHPMVLSAALGASYDEVMGRYHTEAKRLNPKGTVSRIPATGARGALFLIGADAVVAGPNARFRLVDDSVVMFTSNPYTDPTITYTVALDVERRTWRVYNDCAGPEVHGGVFQGILKGSVNPLTAASDSVWASAEALPVEQRRFSGRR